jgi:multicomponent Na+:H+ antiporter subunit F
MTITELVYLGVGALLAAAALLALYRIVRGPSLLDRMIASDMLLTTMILVVGAEMAYNHHTRNVPMMVVLASVAIFATVAVARYVSKQDRQASPEQSSAQTEEQ